MVRLDRSYIFIRKTSGLPGELERQYPDTPQSHRIDPSQVAFFGPRQGSFDNGAAQSRLQSPVQASHDSQPSDMPLGLARPSGLMTTQGDSIATYHPTHARTLQEGPLGESTRS